MTLTCRAFCAAVIALAATGAPAGDPPPRRLMIISVDGTRPDALQAADAPEIKSLFEGAATSWQAQAAVGVGDYPVSGSSYSSMLTGVWCAKHKVCENDFTKSRFDLYPVFYCRLKEVRPDLVIQSIVRWGPLSPNLVQCADVNLAPSSDQAAADKAVELLSTTDPDVFFFHIEDVDTAGHSSGFTPVAAGYLDAIHTADGRVGQVLRALRARPAFGSEGWLIILLTDHGGRGKDHHILDCPECKTIFMALQGSRAAPGEMAPAPALVDVAATALAFFAVPIDPAWDFDGIPMGLEPDTPPSLHLQLPADANQDGLLDLGDPIWLLGALFFPEVRTPPCGGAWEGDAMALLDANGDAGIDLSDAVYVLFHLFADGPPPVLGSACVDLMGCPDVCTAS